MTDQPSPEGGSPDSHAPTGPAEHGPRDAAPQVGPIDPAGPLAPPQPTAGGQPPARTEPKDWSNPTALAWPEQSGEPATPALSPATAESTARSESAAPASPRLAAPLPAPPSDPSASSAAAKARDTLLELALRELQQRRQALEQEITGLEQRRDQIQKQIASSFSGEADGIARRVKGFQDYLVGALQDLVVAAEQIELVAQPVLVQPSPLDRQAAASLPEAPPPVAAGLFSQDEALIRTLLKTYSGQPDFYADPWKLRRTLEPAGAALLDDWFLGQGGRGAQPSSGSRNRNVLIAAAAVAILGELYGDRFQTLVLAGQPERLGEWRRGLQDCLGLSRDDFGPSSGIVLFERSEAVIERADRLEERGELPFIVIDAAERVVDIPLLQFPLWLAFAASPDEIGLDEDL